MDQSWFEMRDVRRRFFAKAVWIPLRASQVVLKTGRYGYVGNQEEFFGVGTIAVLAASKPEAQAVLDWHEVGISHEHSGRVDNGIYIPAHCYRDYQGRFEGEHLVLDQRGNGAEPNQWHLAQDLSITLGLKREGDVWVRPEEGYVEVARLRRNSDSAPELLEIRGGHLRDYLAARELSLCVTSYRQRVEIRESSDGISWVESPVTDGDDTDRWEGRIVEICEGGMPYGESAAVMHVKRTDVDPQEDVPQFDFPTGDVTESRSWTVKHEGKKLYRIEGELWRNEWVDPAEASPIVRGDKPAPTVFFITDADGKTESRETLIVGSRWLWFRPEVMMSLVHRRGGSLSWYTRDTGSVRCSPSYGVHFGVNSLGLINVYAKDIGRLPDWQQKIWAGYNISPDGKVSEELLASQMRAEPADTQAPEKFLPIGLRRIANLSAENLGGPIIRDHEAVPEVLSRTHRFRATDKAGLYSLAKDLARLTADSFDAAAIQTTVIPAKGERRASLKSLEHLIALRLQPRIAHEMLGSLFGVYELRHGDAHLPSKEVDHALKLAGVDQAVPYVQQGYQMLHACVSSLFGIAEVLKHWNE